MVILWVGHTYFRKSGVTITFPGADKSLRMFGFLDAGNVFDEGQKVRAQDMRASMGLGISWLSPMGPLKLSFGKTAECEAGDRRQGFQFTMGTGF